MQNQNPSEDDSTNMSPSSPSDDTPHSTNNNNNPHGESLIMKTVWQVLEELGGSGDDSDSDSGFGDGAPMAVAIGGRGGEDDGEGVGGIGGGATVVMETSDGDNDNNGDNSGSNMVVAIAVGGGDSNGSSGGGVHVTVSVAVNVDGSDHGGDSSGGGGPMAVYVAVGGGSTMMKSVVVSTEGVQGRKRKTSIMRGPPTGRPICPFCQKEFPTWKDAFDHMRAHPDRDYRGFFKPPVFGSPSSTQDEPPSDDKGDDSAKKSSGEVNNGEKGSTSLHVQVPMFDLNEPIEEEGSSHAGEPVEDISTEEGKGSGFDLNEMPPAED